MRSASGEALHLRLFLEGIEVPVIDAEVAVGIGSPATAAITIIPTARALRILPRTVVHLFYLDYAEAEYEGSPSSPDELYKLLFAGEVFDIGHSKAGAGSRGLQLQCMDCSNIWDTNYLFTLKYSDTGGEPNAIIGNQSQFYGVSTDFAFDDIVGQPEQRISAGLQQSAADNPALAETQGVVGGLFYILEYLGGVRGVTRGVNDFTTIEEARMRLMDQLGGDSGQTAVALFTSQVFIDWCTQIQGAGGATLLSFRDLIKIICGFVYYDVVPNPVARYIAGERKMAVPNAQSVLNSAVRAAVASVATSVPAEEVLPVNDTLPPLSTFMRLAPGATKLHPFTEEQKRNADAIQRIAEAAGMPRAIVAAMIANSFAESNLNAKIRSGFRPPNPREFIAKHGPDALTPDGFENSIGLFQLFIDGAGKGMTDAQREDPEQNTQRILQDKGVAAVLAAYFHSVTDFGELTQLWGKLVERFAGSELPGGGAEGEKRKAQARIIFADGIGINSGGFAEGVAVRSILTTTAIDAVQLPKLVAAPAASRERLLSQLFRPEIWFTPPPLCNVLFPDDYTELNYNRSMLREVTRLELETQDQIIAGGTQTDTLTSRHYFAPTFADGEGLVDAGFGSAAPATITGRPLIYAHEKFSGIVPKQERISNASLYSAQETTASAGHALTTGAPSGAGAARSSATPDQPDPNADIENTVDKYAANAAGFNFLKYRYEARSVSISGRFLPRVVCGFPVLAIDRPDAVDGVRPTHFIGMCQGLRHSMSQSGGQTTLTLSHVRAHHGGDLTDDLFIKGRILASQQTQADVLTTLDVAQFGTTADGVGASVGRIDQFQFLLSLKDAAIEPGGRLVLPEGMLGPSGLPIAFVQALDAVPTTITRDLVKPPTPFTLVENVKGSAVEFTQSRGAEITFPFSSVQVHERPDGAILPVEEAIRPPWISNEYANRNIGVLVHQKLLGCDSIIDTVGAPPPKGYTSVTIEQATEHLVNEYTKLTAGDIQATAYTYRRTKRPVATLPQILGDHKHVGFHQYAVGPYDQLEHLDLAGVSLPAREHPDKAFEVSSALDPRKERREVVLAYASELLANRGLRG